MLDLMEQNEELEREILEDDLSLKAKPIKSNPNPNPNPNLPFCRYRTGQGPLREEACRRREQARRGANQMHPPRADDMGERNEG